MGNPAAPTNAGLRRVIRNSIRNAVIRRERVNHQVALEEAFDAHVSRGGSSYNWEEPFSFNEDSAEEKADALASKAEPSRPQEFAAARAEIEELGLTPVELMGDAYQSSSRIVSKHEEKLQELERRRREVQRDFDALQKARPAAPDTIDGEAIET